MGQRRPDQPSRDELQRLRLELALAQLEIAFLLLQSLKTLLTKASSP